MLTQAEMEALLNRPLTDIEATNFDTHLENTTERIAQLLCMNFTTGVGTRQYAKRDGYRTIFTDVFTGVPVVTINGTLQDASTYTVRQFDSLNGNWFNSIVFKQHISREADVVEVTADWGFGVSLPIDLQKLFANLYVNIANTSANAGKQAVTSKKIEDYTVTYAKPLSYEDFVSDNTATINRYSLCASGEIRHGRVRYIYE